ncbi:Bystin [Artemisia annua]|uniref:Bystin n=1 Tax=Artemisia annua TaxID=35608 RepID=A0A2U1KUQ4_ARTAN|nr:Bystin [Artemisia annua]
MELFYKVVLLTLIRKDIKQNIKLHFALYQALKKAVYKPVAFSKGLLFPLSKDLQFERSCYNWKRSSKGLYSTASFQASLSFVALMKLAEMEYGGTTGYFIKLLVEKKYALPYRVVDVMISHFMRFVKTPGTYL